MSTFDAADRAVIAEAATARGGYEQLKEAFEPRGTWVVVAACREADRMLERLAAGGGVDLGNGMHLERDAPDEPDGFSVEALNEDGRSRP